MNVEVPGQGSKVQGQWKTGCSEPQKLALACVEKPPGDRRACASLFDAYRECRKEEHAATIKARQQR